MAAGSRALVGSTAAASSKAGIAPRSGLPSSGGWLESAEKDGLLSLPIRCRSAAPINCRPKEFLKRCWCIARDSGVQQFHMKSRSPRPDRRLSAASILGIACAASGMGMVLLVAAKSRRNQRAISGSLGHSGWPVPRVPSISTAMAWSLTSPSCFRLSRSLW